MKIITVSDETKHLIDVQALPGYTIRQTATPLPDGRWTIPVDDEVSTTSLPPACPASPMTTW